MEDLIVNYILAHDDGVTIESIRKLFGADFETVEKIVEKHKLILNNGKVYPQFVQHLIFKAYGRKQ